MKPLLFSVTYSPIKINVPEKLKLARERRERGRKGGREEERD